MPIDIHEARARIADLEPTDRSEIRAHLEALARPRLSGSEGAREAEREVRTRFSALGYDAETLSFSFSSFHGRFAFVVSGVILALGGGLATWLLYVALPVPALASLGAGLLLAVLPIPLGGFALRRLPWGRVNTANLLFRRPDTQPAWILMAHRDTKGQAVPALVRAMAATIGMAAWLALVALAALRLVGLDVIGEYVLAAGAALFACAGVLALGRVNNASPGALDNATGVAALLATAKREESGAVAFLITDGEEMHLAGARDAAQRLPPVQGVINVDGLDDEGSFFVAEGYGWRRRRGNAPQLVAALMAAASVLELPVRRHRLPSTVAVDHVPMAAAGIPALTLLRGRRRSLMRVHRPADTVERLDGRGAAEGATLLAAAIRLLSAEGESRLAGG